MGKARDLANVGSVASTGLQFRNKIINGHMMVDQRNNGNSVTSQSYLVDRWRTWFDPGTYSFQQVTDAPPGFSHSLRVTKTNTTQSNYGIILQHIEGFNIADLAWGTANAQPVALSFWVKSSVTGTFTVSLTNADSATRSYLVPYTVNQANTWEQKIAMIPGSTSGTWLTNNGTGLQVKFNFGSGVAGGSANTWLTGDFGVATGATANLGTTNGATLQITGVQLEKGTQATPFEYRPYGTELALCQRYYENFTAYFSVNLQVPNGSYTDRVVGTWDFKSDKRATPTVGSFPGLSFTNLIDRYGVGTINASAVNMQAPNIQRSQIIVVLTSSGWSTQEQFQFANPATPIAFANAEL